MWFKIFQVDLIISRLNLFNFEWEETEERWVFRILRKTTAHLNSINQIVFLMDKQIAREVYGLLGIRDWDCQT